MSEKSEKPVYKALNFNFQGSISLSDKPPAPPKPKPPGIEIIFVVLVLFLFLYLISSSAPPPATNKPLPTSTELGFNGYTVLVGSFTNQPQANILAAQLRAARINNSVLQANGQWFVCVGNYSNAGRAKRTMQDLKNRGWTNAVVLAPKGKSG